MLELQLTIIHFNEFFSESKTLDFDVYNAPVRWPSLCCQHFSSFYADEELRLREVT